MSASAPHRLFNPMEAKCLPMEPDPSDIPLAFLHDCKDHFVDRNGTPTNTAPGGLDPTVAMDHMIAAFWQMHRGKILTPAVMADPMQSTIECIQFRTCVHTRTAAPLTAMAMTHQPAIPPPQAPTIAATAATATDLFRGAGPPTAAGSRSSSAFHDGIGVGQHSTMLNHNCSFRALDSASQSRQATQHNSAWGTVNGLRPDNPGAMSQSHLQHQRVAPAAAAAADAAADAHATPQPGAAQPAGPVEFLGGYAHPARWRNQWTPPSNPFPTTWAPIAEASWRQHWHRPTKPPTTPKHSHSRHPPRGFGIKPTTRTFFCCPHSCKWKPSIPW